MFPNDIFLKHAFFAMEKEYKRLLKKLKRKFHNSLLDNIEALAKSNPKEYWKLVNSLKANQTSNVSDIIPPPNGLTFSKF